MDEHRVDQIARSLARGGDRRRVFRGMAAGALATVAAFRRGTGTAAQESVGPGGTCTMSAQCLQNPFDLAVICADNGIAPDGALNCCRNEGGGCTGGSGCCGALLCTNGVCASGGISEFPARGSLAPGAICGYAGECDQSFGETDCADNGLADDGTLNCCRYQGGACATSDACCGGLLCLGGVCASPTAETTGLLPGAACASTSQCNQTGGSVVCADNGILADGALNCCRTTGGACTAANDSAGCCGGLICVNGACQ